MTTLSKKRKPRHSRKTDKWYADGLRFTCRRCGACCSGDPGHVWVTQREMARIARYLKMDVEAFMREYVRRAGSGHSLIERRNGDCIFLDENGCRIYRVRPAQCTTWPFWKSNLRSPEAWEKRCSTCPGGGQGRRYTYSEIRKLLVKQQEQAE